MCLNILRTRDGRLTFASGQDNHAAGLTKLRSEFLALSGPIPHLPQWAFGLWFTWYHPYNQSEKTAEVQRFIDDDLGLDVRLFPICFCACVESCRGGTFRRKSDVASSLTRLSSHLRRRFQASKKLPS